MRRIIGGERSQVNTVPQSGDRSGCLHRLFPVAGPLTAGIAGERSVAIGWPTDVPLLLRLLLAEDRPGWCWQLTAADV